MAKREIQLPPQAAGWTALDIRTWVKAARASEKMLKRQIKTGQHWINDPVQYLKIRGELGL